MKKFLLTCMIALAIGVFAQVGPPQASTPNTLNGYGFMQSSGTYTTLSAGRTVWQSGAALGMDAVSSAVALPSVFIYNGKSYTNIYISNNGYITFGAAPLSSTTTGLSTDNTTNLVEGAVAGFSANLRNANTTTSEIAYETVGSKFIVQFTDLQSNTGSAAQLLNFQIQLDTSNNTISIVYGTCASGTATFTGQVGLKGAESSDVNNRTGSNWTTTAIGTSNTSNCTLGTTGGTTIPASGLTFTYDPGTWMAVPATYATLPFAEDFSSWVNGNSTADLPNATYWRTWPSRGDNSWRASDISTSGFTSASGWTSTFGAATIAAPAVTPTARFHSYNIVGVSGYMDLYVDLSTGGAGNRIISFDYINTSGTDKLDVLLSTDGGITFTNLGSSLTTATSWSNKNFVTTSTSSGAILRFLATGDNGSTDIQMDNLSITVSTLPPSCTTISSPVNAATGVSVIPTITWAAAAGATSYEIIIGTTAGGNDVMPLTDVGNVTTVTSPTIPTLAYNSTYYVTVYPKNVYGTATGCTSGSFTTLATVPCPTVASPIAGATGVSLTPNIAWSAVPGVTGYRISMGTTSGGTDILNNIDVGNVTTYTLGSALNTSATYYYTVNAYSGSVNSSSCTVRNFTTICNAYIPDYTNNFSTFPGACWSRLNGGSPSTGPGTGTTNYWVEDGFLNSGSAGAAKINLFTTGRIGWLISPPFDLSSGGYRVKFDYGVTAFSATGSSAMGSDDVVQFIVSTDGGFTWTVLQTWNAANAPSNTSNTYIFDLTAYTGNNVIFAMYGNDGTIDDTQDYDFFVDNFIVEAIPTCDAPTGLSSSVVTTTSATLSWTAPTVAPSNGYDVYYDNSNTAPTASTIPSMSGIMTISASLTLTSASIYYAWVRSNCGGTQSIWVGPVSFTPPPANDNCAVPTALTVGTDFNSSAITVTNTGATADGTAQTCQTNVTNNVWYSVVVPASGNLKIETGSVSGSTYTDSVINVFSGSCGSLTPVACDDDSSTDGNFSLLSLTGQTPGATLLISVWRFSTGTGTDGQFKVAAYDTTVLAANEVKGDVKEGIKLYPNPFTEVLNISDAANVKNVIVADISGRLVKTIGNPGKELYLGELKQGMYLITLEMKDGSKQTMKAIKK
ncbi:beta strand repeat-containing protein [Chryseobacterium profundimaris]|uniref:Por secretion system C-terminal sorting domain-containing protein n=1 Tax=Chryseobacterium profundimaris TaxID=1387275 RepID=A0ABY1P1G6_9FLAO|nr:T9SS type A sorting domain-containing protein [Chryseobacterium profundimaris]SMP24100.1 Por secretion system C-terminal sorting domain-containing protein [Chryseobacterium profundimaris]